MRTAPHPANKLMLRVPAREGPPLPFRHTALHGASAVRPPGVKRPADANSFKGGERSVDAGPVTERLEKPPPGKR
jgi:hypothetical protein